MLLGGRIGLNCSGFPPLGLTATFYNHLHQLLYAALVLLELMLANTLVTKPANTFTWFVRHATSLLEHGVVGHLILGHLHRGHEMRLHFELIA